MRFLSSPVLISLALGFSLAFANAESGANDPFLQQFHPLAYTEPDAHFLHTGDKLAICGDSITEQKKYSRIMETYLTVCVPEMEVSVRQYGWGGERAVGFLARMTNDCLRFNPTAATTCYGMNDHEYRPYEDSIGAKYHDSMTGVVQSFRDHKVRVLLGSPGCIGKVPFWGKNTNTTVTQLNENLCQLRNIDVAIAQAEHVDFADVFWPMLEAWHAADVKYGPGYALAGPDGVHPDWAGHVVMAYAFLKQFGLSGELGVFTVDLESKMAGVSSGHELIKYQDGTLEIKSSRYPFCIGEGALDKSDSIHSGVAWVPFNEELNRMKLIVTHAQAKRYRVTWGTETKEYSAERLSRGINLPAEFLMNPFTPQFKKVDEAVAEKQAFETKEVKEMFRSLEAKADLNGVTTQAEKQRDVLVNNIKAAFVPVTHTIKIEAL